MPDGGSLIESLRRSAAETGRAPDVDQIYQALQTLDNDTVEFLLHDWTGMWARPNQKPPDHASNGHPWTIWLNLGGRGSGKTRAGAEWIRSRVMAGSGRIALVGPTAAATRDVMVEGESGLLAVCSRIDRDLHGSYMGRPHYEPSKRRVSWENGARATLFSADEPDRLRGPQHHDAWCDEIVTWRYQRDAWDMLMFGLRLGHDPRCVVTTTPKPQPLIKEIVAAEDTALTRSTTYDNASNLAASFFKKILSRYEGTRLGRQEIEAAIIDDMPGALWRRVWLDEHRCRIPPVELVRIVVAVDPAIGSGEGHDENGIIAAGRGADRRGYVLADTSLNGSPEEWSRRAIQTFDEWGADRIIYESNQGGDMVASVLRNAAKAMAERGERRNAEIPLRAVHASRGKTIRAEPISALYEQGRVSHCGMFGTLEDQMCSFTIDFDRKEMGYSPDRLDAAVWALTDLMLGSADVNATVVSVGEGRVSPWRM